MRRNGLNFNRRRRTFNLPLFKAVLSWSIAIAITLFLAFIVVFFFGLRTSVVGQAMESTLSNGDQILINRFSYMLGKPGQNDVIVFLPNGNEKSHYYVRRVAAVPGDTVQIRDGAVYVNDELYDMPEGVASIDDPGLVADPVTLGEDEYFVLGDNRNNSEDSRYANIGNVKEDYIIGRAWYRITSFGNMGRVK